VGCTLPGVAVASTVIFHRILSLAALSLGTAGVIACLAAVYGVWTIRSSVDQRTSTAFASIDGLLVVVSQRVAKARERVEESKITLKDLEKSLNNWAQREARERLAARLDVEERADQLTAHLAEADHWLEVSVSSLSVIRQAMEIGNASGASLDTEPVEQLRVIVEGWRGEIADAANLVQRIRAGVAGTDAEKSLEERFQQAAGLALRVVATLTSVGDRLQGFGNRVSEVRTRVEQLKARTMRWIRNAAIACTLLLAWMAAGQGALCLVGRKTVRAAMGLRLA